MKFSADKIYYNFFQENPKIIDKYVKFPDVIGNILTIFVYVDNIFNIDLRL